MSFGRFLQLTRLTLTLTRTLTLPAPVGQVTFDKFLQLARSAKPPPQLTEAGLGWEPPVRLVLTLALILPSTLTLTLTLPLNLTVTVTVTLTPTLTLTLTLRFASLCYATPPSTPARRPRRIYGRRSSTSIGETWLY